MLSTAHLRELTAAASRVFGWDNATPQVTHNQLVITADQLRQIRMLREPGECSAEPMESSEEVKEKIGRLGTPEGQEELRRTASEWLGREQNVEQPTLPGAAPPRNLPGAAQPLVENSWSRLNHDFS